MTKNTLPVRGFKTCMILLHAYHKKLIRIIYSHARLPANSPSYTSAPEERFTMNHVPLQVENQVTMRWGATR